MFFHNIIRLKKVRDDKGEAAFTGLIELWSLEGITCMTLNRRLGLLTGENKHPQADHVLKVNLTNHLKNIHTLINNSSL